MPVHTWPFAHGGIRHVDGGAWGGDASGLVVHAMWSVDSLHYLADLDGHAGNPENPPMGHAWGVIDVAHVRWATSTAMTAIDLCSAALARRYGIGPKTNGYELDFRDLERKWRKASLTPHGATWVDAVAADPDLAAIEELRNPMIHARVPRQFFRGGGESGRTHMEAAGVQREVGAWVLVARDFATRHVEAFVNAADAGQLEP